VGGHDRLVNDEGLIDRERLKLGAEDALPRLANTGELQLEGAGTVARPEP
jgi:hypothetical protein